MEKFTFWTFNRLKLFSYEGINPEESLLMEQFEMYLRYYYRTYFHKPKLQCTLL